MVGAHLEREPLTRRPADAAGLEQVGAGAAGRERIAEGGGRLRGRRLGVLAPAGEEQRRRLFGREASDRGQQAVVLDEDRNEGGARRVRPGEVGDRRQGKAAAARHGRGPRM